jgi:hypothetical protein
MAAEKEIIVSDPKPFRNKMIEANTACRPPKP